MFTQYSLLQTHIRTYTHTRIRVLEFRSLDPSAQQAGFGRLLRTYQVEVDNLTRRSRAAESNFLALYKALADLSDPVPGLLSATVCVNTC